MTTNPLELIDKAIHRGEESTPPEETTPATVLDSLDWSENDSAQDLIERVDTGNGDGEENGHTEPDG
jgi:hypothetical protein